MYKDLKEKLEYEYEKYFSYLKLISRTDFFSRSFEIAAKTAIYNSLIEEFEKNNIDDDKLEIMMKQEDLLDFLYFKTKSSLTIVNEKLTKESIALCKIIIKF